jgi:hypothetical protein
VIAAVSIATLLLAAATTYTLLRRRKRGSASCADNLLAKLGGSQKPSLDEPSKDGDVMVEMAEQLMMAIPDSEETGSDVESPKSDWESPMSEVVDAPVIVLAAAAAEERTQV